MMDAPKPPESLTDGIPDPASVKRQQAGFQKNLEEQLKQGIRMLDAQRQQQSTYIRQHAKFQKEKYNNEVDEKANQQLAVVHHEHEQQMTMLQQAIEQQRIVLEQQAMQLKLEYQTRSKQDQMIRQKYMSQKEFCEAQEAYTDKMMKLPPLEVMINGVRALEEPAQSEHVESHVPPESHASRPASNAGGSDVPVAAGAPAVMVTNGSYVAAAPITNGSFAAAGQINGSFVAAAPTLSVANGSYWSAPQTLAYPAATTVTTSYAAPSTTYAAPRIYPITANGSYVAPAPMASVTNDAQAAASNAEAAPVATIVRQVSTASKGSVNGSYVAAAPTTTYTTAPAKITVADGSTNGSFVGAAPAALTMEKPVATFVAPANSAPLSYAVPVLPSTVSYTAPVAYPALPA